MTAAINRRLYEELGVRCPLHFPFKLQYQAQFDATGAEHELCSVFIARCNQPVRVNPHEILACRWVDPEALQAEISAEGAEKFTPWFMLEWVRIWRDHRAAVLGLQSSPLQP
jgi:isopentenyl-diphosphate Delta-isomerase